jgi:predicted AlkP superfamily pyrophosphatase or phosphodiesterase
MIHDLRHTTLAAQQHGQFIYPAYKGHSFADIPNTVLSLFGADAGRPVLSDTILSNLRAKKFKNIVVLLIDGLGFEDWIGHAVRYPFFQRISERGDVFSLTAVFPSTTSASLTTFFSTQTPQEHGLPEWNIYLKELGDVINTLPFKRWNGRYADELIDLGFAPSLLYEGTTLFEKLKAHGVSSTCFNHRSYAFSAYSSVTRRGASAVGFLNGSDLMAQLCRKIQTGTEPRFFWVYWDGFDNLEHAYAPGGQETQFELESISRIFLEQWLQRIDKKVAAETLLLVTADHGHIRVYPERMIMLSKYPDVAAALQLNQRGQAILPTGNIRNLFLHIRPEKLHEIQASLAQRLAGKAEVWLTQDAIERGLFGIGTATERFRERTGNLLVLPYADQIVWWEYPGRKDDKMHFHGHHGGLSPTEMFIPLGAAMLGDLMGA